MEYERAARRPPPDAFTHLLTNLPESERLAYHLTAEVATLTGETMRYEGGTFRPGMPAAQIDREEDKILARCLPNIWGASFSLGHSHQRRRHSSAQRSVAKAQMATG